MNTAKNTLENQIKKQIEERKIVPSRDLWSEIENQIGNDRPRKNFNWLLVAACLILTFSLGIVLFFNNNEGHPKLKVNVAQKAVQPDKTITGKIQPESSVMIVGNQKKPIETKKIQPEKKEDTPSPQLLTENKQLPVIRESIAVPEISQIPPAKIIAQSDSSKVPVKKRYVDPSTLLFSVEHKDVIEKTKDKTNVATIDLNGK